MTAPNTPPEGTILPGISSLISDLHPCPRRPLCPQVFGTAFDMMKHDQTCTAPVPLHPIQTQFNISRSPSVFSDGTDSSSSSAVYTPNVSRAPSLGPYGCRISQTGTIQKVRTSPTQPSPPRQSRHRTSDHKQRGPKATKKMHKEKESRYTQADVPRRNEALLRNYTGWERIEQSGGNGNSAGLFANKIVIAQGAEAMLNWLVHEAYCRALAEGRLQEWQEQANYVIEGALPGAPGEVTPYIRTFLHRDKYVPCAHEDSKAKECFVHGHPDWRQCRKMHDDATFRENVQRYVRRQQMHARRH